MNKFKELRFNRFIERFDLNGLGTAKVNKKIDDLFKIEEADIKKILEVAKESKELIYYFEKEKMQTIIDKLLGGKRWCCLDFESNGLLDSSEKAPAATKECELTVAPSNTFAPMPIRQWSLIIAPCRVTECPIETKFPISN